MQSVYQSLLQGFVYFDLYLVLVASVTLFTCVIQAHKIKSSVGVTQQLLQVVILHTVLFYYLLILVVIFISTSRGSEVV